MANLFSGLNNLPIFEGRTDADTRRALLEAGLGMLAPQAPGGNALTQIGGGIQAGLNSLDTTEATNTANEQAAFDNIIKGRGASSAEVRATAAKTTSESTTTVAETGANRQAQDAQEFKDEKILRDAKVLLDTEVAGWMKRRWSGPPGATSKVTTAMTNADVITNWKKVLLAADPVKYTLPDGTTNDAMLVVDAFGSMHKQTDTASSENLASILGGGEAAAISEEISTIQGRAPGPGSISTLPPVAAPIVDEVSGGDLPVVVTAEDREKVPIGSDYIHNGVRRTRQ